MNSGLYLDTRRTEGDGEAPLRYAIRKDAKTSFISLGVNIPVKYWDRENRQILNVPVGKWPERARIYNYVMGKVSKYDTMLLTMEVSGELHGMSANDIRDKIMEKENPKVVKVWTLCEVLEEYISHIDNKRTAAIYGSTLNRMRALMPGVEKLTLEKVSPEWIAQFSEKLKEGGAKSENARAIHLRNLRAVQNYAITQEYTEHYPWRKVKIKREETEKRSMSVDELREFMKAKCDKRHKYYQDMFMLMFMLVGINHADLADLKEDDLRDGRIHYERKKTHHIYNIKVEPEAEEIIGKYKGKDWLVDIHDKYKDPHDQLKHFNPMLAGIIDRSPFNELTTYWTRHTWATIAFNDLDIPIETISAALGHQYGSRVTAVYINPNQRKVDEANRRVLDWVLYGKR